MSKALLILPEMPDNCFKCEYRRFYVSLSGEIHYFCGAPVGKPGEPVDDFETCRPDWCPLKPMPPKMPIREEGYGSDILTKTEHEGWNKCLRAIEGSGEDG